MAKKNKTEKILITTSVGNIKGDMIKDISVQCLDCIHLYDNLLSCKAFPDGIPEKIISGGWDHKKAYDGDMGIRFELRADIKKTGKYS